MRYYIIDIYKYYKYTFTYVGSLITLLHAYTVSHVF